MPPSTIGRWALYGVLIGALIHLVLGFTIEFSVDEAHYALYAKHLAWSYFDHPPLVGWIQWPLIILNANEGVIRFIPEILWLISCALVYCITNDLIAYLKTKAKGLQARQLPTKPLASFAALIAVVLAPLPHVLAVGLLPDSLLTPLVLTLLWLAIRWLQQVHTLQTWQWLLMGLVLGLAGLSKYTAVFSAVALALVFLLSPRKSWLHQPNFWLAVLLALLAISPIIFWNWAHAWISFQYQLNHGGGGAWSWLGIGRFFGIQLLAYGPLLPLGGFIFMRYFVALAKPQLLSLLAFFIFPFTLFAVLSAGGGLPHWTSPAWFCLAPFAGIGLAALWLQSYRWLLSVCAAVQLLLCLLGFSLVFIGGISFNNLQNNPIADLYGWKLAGTRATQLAQGKQAMGTAVQNWTLASRLAWYSSPLPIFVLDQRQDQFDLWFGPLPPQANVILVNWSGMPFNPPLNPDDSRGYFNSCESLETLSIDRFSQHLARFEFSFCQGWNPKALSLRL